VLKENIWRVESPVLQLSGWRTGNETSFLVLRLGLNDEIPNLKGWFVGGTEARGWDGVRAGIGR
jgi:hypothetical protein